MTLIIALSVAIPIAVITLLIGIVLVSVPKLRKKIFPNRDRARWSAKDESIY